MSPNFKNIIANLDNKPKHVFINTILKNKFSVIISFIAVLLIILNVNIYINSSILNTLNLDDIQVNLSSFDTLKDDIIRVDINMINKNQIHFNTVNVSIKFNSDEMYICDQSGSIISQIYNNIGNARKNEIIIEKNIGFINIHTTSYEMINQKEMTIGYFYVKPINTNNINLTITNASFYILTESKIDVDIEKKDLSISIIQKKDTPNIISTDINNNTNTSMDKINKEIQNNITNGPVVYTTYDYDKPRGITFKQKSNNDIWFVDIYGHWAMDDIIKLKKLNIILGDRVGDNLMRFYPDQFITKGDFLYILLHAFNINILNIDDKNKYNNIIYTARQLNLIDDNFNQYDKINKIEALDLLYKVSIPIYFDKDRYIIYKDIKKTDAFSDLISWAIDRKIDKIIAYKSDKFYPYNNITRAEMAKIITTLKKM